ncbi:MAG: 30S ribosomal protein S20 [Hyphomonadaceae bacterium]|nr:30S ribosomal protein S20 [Hyphomonadaceae bacterium]
MAALKVGESEIMRAVSKGVIHKNTASRTVARLAARVKAVATAA